MIEKDNFEVFWQSYPADLCNRKGSKAKAKKIYEKFDVELQKQIITNMREMMRVDRAVKKAGEFVPKWGMVTSWLGGERWEDIHDIRQSADMPKTEAKECKNDDCHRPWKHATGYCWECYEKAFPNAPCFTLNDMKSQLINVEGIKPNGNRQEWIEECKRRAIPRYSAALNR